jgi:hypothetical membrane protein
VSRSRSSPASARRRLLLACGVAAPALALASSLLATVAYPGLDPARQYLSELGGAGASAPFIFNDGVFAAGVLAALAGGGFGLAIVELAGARIAGVLIAAVFALSGFGLTQAALYPFPDPRHLAINLALGIEVAPLLFLWGLWRRRDLRGLKLFLAVVFVVMAALTVVTRHLLFPKLVGDANVGLWERAYAILLVSWVAVAAFLLDRRLRQDGRATKKA